MQQWQDDAIDVCGTGGDKQHTFNISTTVTFVVAAAGIPVFKHGNRSITSKCGSSNLLEALGVNIMGDDALLKRSMEELGFCFMFAPAFHPAFKEIMPVRQKLAEMGHQVVVVEENPGSTNFGRVTGIWRDHQSGLLHAGSGPAWNSAAAGY